MTSVAFIVLINDTITYVCVIINFYVRKSFIILRRNEILFLAGNRKCRDIVH